MRFRSGKRWSARRALVMAAVVLLLAGCGHAAEIVVPAETFERGRADLGLGPGVRPLSAGPGDKGSPSWSPSGDRIAFALDGYVVDGPTEEPPDARDLRRRTTRDFGAEEVDWVASEDGLAILAADLSKTPASASPGEKRAPRAVYRTGSESLDVDEIATGVLAISPLPDGGLTVALETGPARSTLAMIDGGGEVSRTYPYVVAGRISALSVSPDGSKAAMAVRRRPSGSFEIHAFNLLEGTSRRLMELPPGEEVFGAPQWTKYGIFYVAGESRTDEGEDAAPYDLYRLPPDSGEPGPVRGVGEDFVASSLRASPDGERLAVVGRRNPNSPTDLYVLDLDTGILKAATANENMEIKTDPKDLAWSADGDHVAIVARGILSGPRVYAARVGTLLADFYNIYDVPVGDLVSTREDQAG